MPRLGNCVRVADASVDAAMPDLSATGPSASADVPEFTLQDAAAGSLDAPVPAVDVAVPAVDLPSVDVSVPEATADVEVSGPDGPGVDADIEAGGTAELPGVSGALGSKKKKGSLFKGLFGRKKGDSVDISGALSCPGVYPWRLLPFSRWPACVQEEIRSCLLPG